MAVEAVLSQACAPVLNVRTQESKMNIIDNPDLTWDVTKMT